ncbi:ClpP/crotonase-like domain-containing protein [Catenaria anguillulae PL171]|uniref:ClpP/crotonase-like domain-containing protein n=1 Tax=Catenaria anguillulae PL171 TaxID=765915 RepID=A0A1Y2I0R5_9FUNG|nr:ClpP/crotonase-like domain-containing protein [Catenaria anguillulae PL171]
MSYATLAVSTPAGSPHVAVVHLNRPRQLNTMTDQFFSDVHACFTALSANPDIRVIVLASASEKIFTAGLDLKAVQGSLMPRDDPARTGVMLMDLIRRWQNALSCLETCRVPVIAAIHGACIGGGVDLVTAADIRVCSEQSWFCVKEVDLAMAADIGTLQRLPKVVGNQSIVREWCYTGRNVSATEALAAGLVSHVAKDRRLCCYALDLANTIASKSPVAINGTKASLVYSRDHSVDDSLKQIAMWNSSQLQAGDVMEAAAAILSKTTPKFPKL